MKRLLLVLTLFCNSAFASESLYQSALKAYQDRNYPEAETAFRDFLKAEPENTIALYNYGLAAYQQNKKGLAVAAWRKALRLDPDMNLAKKALFFAQTEMPAEVFNSDSSYWESLRNNVLNQAPLQHFLGLTTLLFLFSAYLGIRYFGARHRALRDEKPLPPFPTVLVFLAVGLGGALWLTTSKVMADLETRATVVASSIELRTGPSAEDNALFELIEGSEVIVLRQVQDWVQVRYPNGLAGWVPAASLF